MPGNSEDKNLLTFQWDTPPAGGRGLFSWFLLVLAGLAIFFYLFQVVYPQSQRFTPVPQQIILLNPADPGTRALLHKVQDHDFLLVPAGNVGATIKLEDHMPLFHPSFEGHRMELQDLPHKPFTVPPARLLEVDAPALPPLDLGELRPAMVPSVTQGILSGSLQLRLSGEIAGRSVLRAPDLSDIELINPTTCRFLISVDDSGEVLSVQAAATTEDVKMIKKLEERLRQMRLNPRESGDGPRQPARGQVSLETKQGGAR